MALRLPVYIIFDLHYVELSDELQQLQEMARKFSREEIVPAAAHHDQTGEVRH